MLVTLRKYLHAGISIPCNSARVSPCWYLHAADSAQATLRKLTKSSWYLHAGDSVQATLRKLTKRSAQKNPCTFGKTKGAPTAKSEQLAARTTKQVDSCPHPCHTEGPASCICNEFALVFRVSSEANSAAGPNRLQLQPLTQRGRDRVHVSPKAIVAAD